MKFIDPSEFDREFRRSMSDRFHGWGPNPDIEEASCEHEVIDFKLVKLPNGEWVYETRCHLRPKVSTIPPEIKGGAKVKRDMELVREILLIVQARTDIASRPVEVDGKDKDTVERHVEMMVEGGLLKGHVQPGGRSYGGQLTVSDMTWEGHDFLSALENETVWGKMKASFKPSELVGLPFSVLKDVGVSLLKKYAMSKVGLGN